MKEIQQSTAFSPPSIGMGAFVKLPPNNSQRVVRFGSSLPTESIVNYSTTFIWHTGHSRKRESMDN